MSIYFIPLEKLKYVAKYDLGAQKSLTSNKKFTVHSEDQLKYFYIPKNEIIFTIKLSTDNNIDKPYKFNYNISNIY